MSISGRWLGPGRHLAGPESPALLPQHRGRCSATDDADGRLRDRPGSPRAFALTAVLSVAMALSVALPAAEAQAGALLEAGEDSSATIYGSVRYLSLKNTGNPKIQVGGAPTGGVQPSGAVSTNSNIWGATQGFTITRV